MRVYSREFRLEVIRRINGGERVPALAQELGVHRKVLYDWARKVREGGEENLRDRGRPRKSQSAPASPPKPAELERMIAQQQLIIGFFRYAFEHFKSERLEKREWRNSIFLAIEGTMQGQGSLSIEAMCKVAGVARSGFYRFLRERGKHSEP
jgi:transposase-like protein